MGKLIGTGRMNRTGATGTLTVPADLAHRFDLDAEGVDVVYFENGNGDVILKPANEVEI